ncbi:RNA polymerase sigma-54 factor [bacterium]|nr:MAG: RNA polymerase sigma-54 factor [bacterium]
MALEFTQKITQDIRLTQELVMTPQLQQAIKLLQLNRMELLDRVQEELEENPLLEEVKDSESEEPADSPTALLELTPETVKDEALPKEIEEWEQYLAAHDQPPVADHIPEPAEERTSFENYIAPETTLHDHLLWQLRMGDVEQREFEIGEVIIGNIDDDGYLRSTVEEIAETLNEPVSSVERVLSLIQDFDPTGVASRSLEECLMRQAEDREAPAYVKKIISEGIKYLESKNYPKMARDLGITLEEANLGAKFISGLEPKPGRAFFEARVDYVVPDVYVTKRGDEYVVQLNNDGLPHLRVSPYYRSILKNESDEGKAAKGYIQERIQAAMWLIRAIEQRQQTLLKVANSIVKFQKNFFDNGVTQLRPLILRDVADDIGMHESTVSRVTTGKYMSTPQGTFELKYFFSSAISRHGGEDLASRSVKARIKEVVSREDSGNPLSDQEIAKILEKEFSLKIARRTVSKYRESMGILPSGSRRSYS